MKISEMHGIDALTLLCDISVPAARVMQDPMMAQALKDMGKLDILHTPKVMLYAQIMTIFEPVLRAHMDDVVQIAAALTGKTVGDVRKQPLPVTIREVRSVWDKDLRDFFSSSGDTAHAE